MLSYIFFTLSLSFAKTIILTPKQDVSFDFAYEHNIELLSKIGDFTLYKTHIDNYNTFSRTFNELFEVEEEQVYTINPHNDIVYVQEPGDNEYKLTSSKLPWHLDRISKKHLPLDNTYPYSESGSCHRNSNVEIHTYVVDTGVDSSHPEFEGRAEFLENFTGDNEDFDGNSHGTHCSGIIGSKTYGVCKDSKIYGIKVLDAQGSGSTSGVIAGMDFAFSRHLANEKKNPNVRSIISMSLGGGYSTAMNRAVENMIKQSNTFYIVVASGNENSDACRTSPASAKGILTVNASGKNDERAYFSNFGKCTDIYTPGVNIKSTIPGGKTAVYSGTSMATPNLVGVLNHYLDENPHLNMKQLKAKILSDATKDTITGNPVNTNNLFVYLNRE